MLDKTIKIAYNVNRNGKRCVSVLSNPYELVAPFGAFLFG